MSRAGRRDLATIVGCAFLLAAILLLWSMTPRVDAGKPPPTQCWWEGTVFHAVNLPDEWSLTTIPSPTGVFPGPNEWHLDYGFSTTFYVWTRGGPYIALFKPGKQLNDYRPVCVAVP